MYKFENIARQSFSAKPKIIRMLRPGRTYFAPYPELVVPVTSLISNGNVRKRFNNKTMKKKTLILILGSFGETGPFLKLHYAVCTAVNNSKQYEYTLLTYEFVQPR